MTARTTRSGHGIVGGNDRLKATSPMKLFRKEQEHQEQMSPVITGMPWTSWRSECSVKGTRRLASRGRIGSRRQRSSPQTSRHPASTSSAGATAGAAGPPPTGAEVDDAVDPATECRSRRAERFRMAPSGAAGGRVHTRSIRAASHGACATVVDFGGVASVIQAEVRGRWRRSAWSGHGRPFPPGTSPAACRRPGLERAGRPARSGAAKPSHEE